MNRTKLAESREWIRAELDRCVNFWLKNGIDPVNGGVYTCLDREGRVFSTDKSVWMQGRCGWVFAWLCRLYGVREEWLAASKSCLDFMEAHCLNHEAGERMYFTVTADGKPLRQRRYYFSEAFYAMANAEYYGVTGDKACLERARRAYELYWDLAHGLPDPTGLGPKTIPETRTGRAFGIPMIYLNVTSVMMRADPAHKALYEERAARGYTTREPDAYLNSSVPRWAQDARDWVAHRDAVMAYALTLMNQVEDGERDAPTMAEFRAGLPAIQWTYTEVS